jgi:hypothetical protein
MFTDGPVTPRRVETLLELVRVSHARTLTKDSIDDLLQPDGLPGLTEGSNQARDTLAAVRELELVDDDDGSVRLRVDGRSRRSTVVRDLVLDALDRKVLEGTTVEPHFALFYSFLLGLGAGAAVSRRPDEWAHEFNRVVNRGQLGSNPFNGTKYTGLRRWYRYAGLGWVDPSGTFLCNPYPRLMRALPRIFDDDRVLDGDAFMARLALTCPELDGGEIFRAANHSYDPRERRCTLGLSHALVELHASDVLRLDCPVDAHGWSIAASEPPRDGATLRSDRITAVEYLI